MSGLADHDDGTTAAGARAEGHAAARPPAPGGAAVRRRVATTAPWAAQVGYSRAVRAGAFVAVSGTAAVGEDGAIVHPRDAYLQARRCCEIIVAALRELDAGPEHVIRTRMYIRDPAHWSDVGRAHGEVFAAAPPATTMIVTGFIDPAMLVEIEADALLPS